MLGKTHVRRVVPSEFDCDDGPGTAVVTTPLGPTSVTVTFLASAREPLLIVMDDLSVPALPPVMVTVFGIVSASCSLPLSVPPTERTPPLKVACAVLP